MADPDWPEYQIVLNKIPVYYESIPEKSSCQYCRFFY